MWLISSSNSAVRVEHSSLVGWIVTQAEESFIAFACGLALMCSRDFLAVLDLKLAGTSSQSQTL
jgi:hypothetical protein